MNRLVPRHVAPQRVVAGKEPGCLFYFIAHSGFVHGREGCMHVPLASMDKACMQQPRVAAMEPPWTP